MREFLIAGLLSCLVSCGTINNIIGQPAATSSPSTKQTSGSERAMRHFFSKKSKKRGEPPAAERPAETPVTVDVAVKADDAKTVHIPERERATATSRAIAEHLDGEWKFDNVFGRSVSGEDDRPYIIFEAGGRNRLYAFDGCNHVNGRYEVIGSDELKLTDVLTTTNYCPDNTQSSEVAAVILQGRYFKLTALRAEEYLEILNDRHQRIGTLHRHCIAALNGMWKVAAIGSLKIDDPEPPTIVIDLLEKRIHGNSGCNLFNGTIYQDPDKDVSVQFQDMRVTRHGCSKVSVETALLVALEKVEMALLDGDTKATLCDVAGNHLITLVRTE